MTISHSYGNLPDGMGDSMWSSEWRLGWHWLALGEKTLEKSDPLTPQSEYDIRLQHHHLQNVNHLLPWCVCCGPGHIARLWVRTWDRHDPKPKALCLCMNPIELTPSCPGSENRDQHYSVGWFFVSESSLFLQYPFPYVTISIDFFWSSICICGQAAGNTGGPILLWGFWCCY